MKNQIRRYHVILDGLVQGVGMRYFVKTTADQMNLTGNVKNLYDGKVEIYVQGEQEKIDSFLSIIKKGNGFSRVYSMDIHEVPLEKHESHFSYDWY